MTDIFKSLVEFLFSSGGGIAASAVMQAMRFTEGEAVYLTAVIELISPFAFGLIVVYLCAGACNDYLLNGREFDIHAFIKVLVSCIVANVLMNAAGYLIGQFLGFSNWFASQMYTALQEADLERNFVDNDVSTAIKDLNLLGLLIGIILGLLNKMINLIAMFFVEFVVFSTKLEILVRMAFAPIGLSGFASADTKNGALRYLRKMLASACYAAALIFVVYVGNAIPIMQAQEGAGDFQNLMLSAAADPKVAAASAAAASAAVSTAASASASAAASGSGLTALVNFLTSCVGTIVVPFASLGCFSAAKQAINEALGA